MKHLKKITISNARRFGKDVEIELSSGANIFLAPNGMGKTTIFEAIEFALTGSIQRLKNPPLSVIRDKEDGVDVRLDFDGGNFCAVNYRKGQNPILSGDHALLFPNRKIEDVSFLLRLTHFIEQRGNNWFIQKNEASEAGDLLDKLSIGKDLSLVAKTKTSTLGAATRTIGEKKAQIEKHREEVSSFENKLRNRDAAKLNYILLPLDEIFSQLERVHKQFSNTSKSVNIDQNLNAITGYRGVVNTVLAKASEDNRQLLLNLLNLEGQLPLYQKNSDKIAEKLVEISQQTEIFQKAIVDLESVRKEIGLLQDVFNRSKDLQTSLQKSMDLLNKRKEEESKLGSIENSIKSSSDSLAIQTEKLGQETVLLERLNEDFSRYNVIRQREAEILQKQGELTSLQSVIDDWNSRIIALNETNVIISKLTSQQLEVQKDIESYELNLSVAEKLLAESQVRLDALKTVSDAILTAVVAIDVNLPEDQSRCPVCNAEYEPNELKRQIAIALQNIDPVLGVEIETNMTLKQNVERVKQLSQEEKAKWSKLAESLSEKSEIAKGIQAFINEKCMPSFPGRKTVSEAEEWLKSEKDENNSKLLKVTADKDDFGNEPSFDELSRLKTSIGQIADLTQSQESRIRVLQTSLDNTKLEIERIDLALPAVDLAELDANINSAGQAVDIAIQNITSKSREAEQIERRKKDAEVQIMDLNLAISKLNGQQNEILNQWERLGFIGRPNLETLINKREVLVKQATVIKQSSEQLDILTEELGRWAAAEKYVLLDREIKGICKSEDEQVYLRRIKSSFQELEQELVFITQRKAALDKLYKKIGEEVNGVHEKIKSINPLWVSLLKKVVINPRFVDTHLNSYPFRNQPQAEVNIDLHNTRVSVMEVASEAQATDLQLTFMLSMASSYRWTPWKSLLLDDPTQHHDLVHAAGVFDLLRDYILDQKFQVLMGTHDAIQGRFFQRKLQNEHIDVKLWRLIANETGVRAEVLG